LSSSSSSSSANLISRCSRRGRQIVVSHHRCWPTRNDRRRRPPTTTTTSDTDQTVPSPSPWAPQGGRRLDCRPPRSKVRARGCIWRCTYQTCLTHAPNARRRSFFDYVIGKLAEDDAEREAVRRVRWEDTVDTTRLGTARLAVTSQTFTTHVPASVYHCRVIQDNACHQRFGLS